MISSRAPLALIIVLGIWSAAPGAAHASCVEPVPKVLWSYPADGDRDVPIDAVVQILQNDWGAKPAMTLNGVAIDPSERSRHERRRTEHRIRRQTLHGLHGRFEVHARNHAGCGHAHK
jgi:hypothetical protein